MYYIFRILEMLLFQTIISFKLPISKSNIQQKLLKISMEDSTEIGYHDLKIQNPKKIIPWFSGLAFFSLVFKIEFYYNGISLNLGSTIKGFQLINLQHWSRLQTIKIPVRFVASMVYTVPLILEKLN